MIIEQRYAEGKILIVPELTGELIRLNPDVIVTDTSRLYRLRKTRPKPSRLSSPLANDPVGDGQVESLARPVEPHRVFTPRPGVELKAARTPQGCVSQDHA